MKNRNTVIVNGKRRSNIRGKVIACILLTIVLIVMIVYTFLTKFSNDEFAKEINDLFKLNSKTVFSIDKIYMYSSANADSNAEDRAIWNLNIHQFTDIAIYINNRSNENLNYENSIKKLYIDNVRFSGLTTGNPALYLKNINDFAKLTNTEENKVSDRLDYKILNDGDLDYSKAEMYADCSSPIVLEYVNSNIKENQIISDISSDLRFDGELLRKSGVILKDISCILGFDITIINNYNQKFIANVYIDIPLEDTQTRDTIYNGKIVKELKGENIIKFFRIE